MPERMADLVKYNEEPGKALKNAQEKYESSEKKINEGGQSIVNSANDASATVWHPVRTKPYHLKINYILTNHSRCPDYSTFWNAVNKASANYRDYPDKGACKNLSSS